MRSNVAISGDAFQNENSPNPTCKLGILLRVSPASSLSLKSAALLGQAQSFSRRTLVGP